MKIDIMGVQFDNTTMDEAVARAMGIMEGNAPAYFVTPNPEFVYEAMHDASFCALLNGADRVLPDGVGILLGGKLLGTPLQEKISGVDFASNLLGAMAKDGKRLYLLGSKPGVAELAADNMRKAHPDLIICGTADGYFKEEGPVVEAINAANPDALFVCLGSPKQEKFIYNHMNELSARFFVGLGGSLDAFAGTFKRAPAWIVKIGMEWFYRLCKEPKRFKRMLRLPKFVFAVLGRRIRGAK